MTKYLRNSDGGTVAVPGTTWEREVSFDAENQLEMLRWAEPLKPIGQWGPFGSGSTKPLKVSHNDVDPYLEILDIVKKIEKRVDGLEEKIKDLAGDRYVRTPEGKNIADAFGN